MEMKKLIAKIERKLGKVCGDGTHRIKEVAYDAAAHEYRISVDGEVSVYVREDFVKYAHIIVAHEILNADEAYTKWLENDNETEAEYEDDDEYIDDDYDDETED